MALHSAAASENILDESVVVNENEEFEAPIGLL